ncbi:hypothetical protein Tco_0052501 [Tanacetum coccineum]
MILESVKHGLLIWPTIEENGVTKTKKYDELSATKKIQADCDLKATNIILQVNTKFLNSLPPKWSNFVTDVKLVKDLHTTNFDQLHAYLEQHELHANEVRLMRERINQQTHLAKFPQIDSGLTVHVFKQGDDPIDPINKMISFLSTVFTPRFPSTNNQLRNSSNPRQQETIHNGWVTVQPLQGRQNSFAAGTLGIRANTSITGGNYSDQQRVVKEKVLLVEAQGNGKVLNEKELEFLANPGIAEGLVTQLVITHNAAYQADDLDAYDSDCDEISMAKAVLMANFFSYGSDVLSKDTNYSAQQDALILYVFEQLSNQVTNCNKVNNDNLIANETLSAKLERYKEQVKLLEERQNEDLGTREKLIIDDIILEKNAQFADFEKEINNLKQTLSEQSKENELLTKTFIVFKNNPRKKKLRISIQKLLWKRKLKN